MKFSTACRGGVVCRRGGEVLESDTGIRMLVATMRKRREGGRREGRETFLSSFLINFIAISAYFSCIVCEQADESTNGIPMARGRDSLAILLRFKYASISNKFTPSTWEPRRDIRPLAGMLCCLGPDLFLFSVPVPTVAADIVPADCSTDSILHPSTKASSTPKKRTRRRRCSPCVGASRVRKRAR
jgi:hypothetical protein